MLINSIMGAIVPKDIVYIIANNTDRSTRCAAEGEDEGVPAQHQGSHGVSQGTGRPKRAEGGWVEGENGQLEGSILHRIGCYMAETGISL